MNMCPYQRRRSCIQTIFAEHPGGAWFINLLSSRHLRGCCRPGPELGVGMQATQTRQTCCSDGVGTGWALPGTALPMATLTLREGTECAGPGGAQSSGSKCRLPPSMGYPSSLLFLRPRKGEATSEFSPHGWPLSDGSPLGTPLTIALFYLGVLGKFFQCPAHLGWTPQR